MIRSHPRTVGFAALLLLAAGLTSSHGLRAQDTTSSTTESFLSGPSGAFLALSVADLDRLVPWYRDTLGFRVHSSGLAPNGKIRFALLQQDNVLIEMLQLPDAKALKTALPGATGPHEIHGFFKAGFVVPDIDAVYRRVNAMKLTLAYRLGKPPGGPYRSFGLRDPEGNLLQFFGR